MTGPVIHVSFDLVGAAIILLVLLLVVAGLVLLTSWYWRRRLPRLPASTEPSARIWQFERLLAGLPEGCCSAIDKGRCSGAIRRPAGCFL